MQVLHMLVQARRRLAIVSANAPLVQVAGLLNLDHIDLAVVCDEEGGMVGVITDRDIVRSISDCRPGDHRACEMEAAAAMTREVVCCRLADQLIDICSMMKKHGLKHIPVVNEDGSPLAVLYARDVLIHLAEDPLLKENDVRAFLAPLEAAPISRSGRLRWPRSGTALV